MGRTDFAARLLDWYDASRRDLPWRGSDDPWAIWVSEVMLQQTRVEVVRQIYPRFMQRFPNPQALAVASDDELLSAWRGLGYYRRARMLREGARQVLERLDVRVPDSLPALSALAGVGDYTSGAIASIAFGQATHAIDGNVERVIARHRAIEENVKRGPAAAAIRDAVLELMDSDRPGDFNQALMDLGATICTPRSPRCSTCPVRADCAAVRRGLVEAIPVVPARRRQVEVVSRAVLVRVPRGRVLGSRIPDGQVNGGQVDLPGAGLLVAVETPDALAEELRRRYGVSFQIGPVITTVHHTITHHRIRLMVHQAQCGHGPGPNLMAARADDRRIPWTTAARKAFQQAALFLAADRS